VLACWFREGGEKEERKKKGRAGWAKELDRIGNLGHTREEEVGGLREENHGPGEGFGLKSKGVILFLFYSFLV
jgi:hypothetical protein